MLLFLAMFVLNCSDRVLEAPTVKMDQPTASTIKSVSFSTVYYVATNGSDTNPGSSAAPFLTIMRAAQVAQPGDEIVVRDGVYTAETSTMNMVSCIGTPENYITFRSETKYGAVLDGKNISSYCFSLGYGASYLKFVDFEIKNFLRFGFDINHSGYLSSYITIQGCKIRDIGRITDTGNNGRCGLYIGLKNHHITIDQNLIYNIGRTGPDDYWLVKDHAIYTATADNMNDAGHHNSITNNIIFSCSGNALNLGSTDDLIANNIIAWTNENSRGGFCFIAAEGAGGRNLSIVNNVFYQPPVSNPYVIVSYSGYSGWSIKHNIVYGGSMFNLSTSATIAAMQGGNYGRKDCENSEVNPLFVNAVRSNAPNVDFRIRPGSPAINAGFNISLDSYSPDKEVIQIPDIGPMHNRADFK